MKSKFYRAMLAGAAAVFPLAGSAQTDFLENFYAKVDVGGSWSSDTELKEYFGPVAPGSEISFEPGLRVGFAVGYDWRDWLATEIEFGATYQAIDKITGAREADAIFSNGAALLNVKLRLPNPTRFTPYIGAGVGGSVSTLDADEIVLNDIYLDGTESDAVFAYQAFGGLRFTLSDNMGLSLEYRYFAADAPEFEADFVYFSTSDKLRMGPAETHSISLAFDFKF